MKKNSLTHLLTYSLLFATAACSPAKVGGGKIQRLTSVPASCTFVHDIETESTLYYEEDAIKYLEDKIEKSGKGNSYKIESIEKRQNEWKMFAPERTFEIKAKVYDC